MNNLTFFLNLSYIFDNPLCTKLHLSQNNNNKKKSFILSSAHDLVIQNCVFNISPKTSIKIINNTKKYIYKL